ncbi:hypothetical protein EG68_01880 [Paragonimus skrjabini miyazakii]|uniref:THO complex subunit 7 n=1 Tax=Paragonimus skrjabini miyazakii TaxID=59628 RepID=A0A8S9Z9W4_9TREM|nr:hypothetical protein EG68_01880 [Paragonimus skrjabini miyazakii]
MSVVSDDEIIKRKLLVEGESGNDDRRLTLLLKNYLRWVASDDVGDVGFETFQALIGSVNQCENAMEQSALVLSMNQEQLNQYSELFKKIKTDMENAKVRMDECKEELRTAKIIRKNRREYDSLAKIIAEHPERDVTLEKCQKLKSQLQRLQELDKEYDRKIALRKKQFHLFLFALNGMQKLIEEDESLSPVATEDPATNSPDDVSTEEGTRMDTN